MSRSELLLRATACALSLATHLFCASAIAAETDAAAEPKRQANEPPPYLFAIEGVVIEAEWLKEEPSVEEQLRRSLAVPQYLVPVERAAPGGGIEVRTRIGRFCSNPLPDYLTSGMIAALPPILPCFRF
jgi:hypothetical protein